ncbi:MAG: zinc ribbon domain-containing protein [Lachnospiraceae bacterium]|nr:zinc ribbon domain-containing protein [Lachnospiraceae bacterium]
MFIIIGTQLKKEDMGCLSEPAICPRCRRLVHYQTIREQRWFTVFWAPLFPVQSSQYLQCPSCGLTFQANHSQPTLADPALTDQSTEPNSPSMLEKGARQAGRLYGRLKRHLNEVE